MTLRDARELEDGAVIERDLCVVGAGAAGITIALAFAGANVRLCLLESGGLEYEQAIQDLYRGENVGLRSFDLDACGYASSEAPQPLGGPLSAARRDLLRGPCLGAAQRLADCAHRSRALLFAGPGTLQLGPLEYDGRAWLGRRGPGPVRPRGVPQPGLAIQPADQVRRDLPRRARGRGQRRRGAARERHRHRGQRGRLGGPGAASCDSRWQAFRGARQGLRLGLRGSRTHAFCWRPIAGCPSASATPTTTSAAVVPSYEALGMTWVTVLVELVILVALLLALALNGHRVSGDRAAPSRRLLVSEGRS